MLLYRLSGNLTGHTSSTHFLLSSSLSISPLPSNVIYVFLPVLLTLPLWYTLSGFLTLPCWGSGSNPGLPADKTTTLSRSQVPSSFSAHRTVWKTYLWKHGPCSFHSQTLSSQVSSNTGFSFCLFHPLLHPFLSTPSTKVTSYLNANPSGWFPAFCLNVTPCYIWCDLLNWSEIRSFFSSCGCVKPSSSPLNSFNSSLMPFILHTSPHLS